MHLKYYHQVDPLGLLASFSTILQWAVSCRGYLLGGSSTIKELMLINPQLLILWQCYTVTYIFPPQDHLVSFHFFPSDYRFISLPSPLHSCTNHIESGMDNVATGETCMEVSTDEKGGVQTHPQAMVRPTLVYHYIPHQPILCVDSDYSRFRVSSPVTHCSLQSLAFLCTYWTVEPHVNSNGS